MSSSGLIYAVIVGAWAAYLVPMWLRRQDELNEARPTERFTTAIRLLAGRSGLERRAKRTGSTPTSTSAGRPEEKDERPTAPAEAEEPVAAEAPEKAAPKSSMSSKPSAQPASGASRKGAPVSASRARVLARRRRVVSLLFLLFTAGAVATVVGGLSLLWAPAVPGLLLSAYIVHLRRQEARRYRERLRRRAAARRAAASRSSAAPEPREAAEPAEAVAEAQEAAPEPERHPEERPAAAPRTASAESPSGSWSPVPLPLPTYVTAPVAPRATERLDLTAPDTFSAARGPAEPEAEAERDAQREQQAAAPRRRPSPRANPRHPSGYQNPYAPPAYDPAEDRPRAANE
ncbi:hypothetical protein BIV57_14895 [Mangrovactinospora gilvigrisea]|uniref:Uncharacterized protein n=1 Tax=Mangrovactinospora gilvigrisea TaxID=1428644 RepID=A0A1J7C529_9ACTN|nr:hypothetical protein [Mangrovactinospora gilvigrisea]OIV36660.1 hypothetical protein BIV57_14895 [Mangrovactinospora gilvigrisea]